MLVEPKVSVIIPFYQKTKGLLSNTIQSIIKQTYLGHIYIIVVDDGSPVTIEEELSTLSTPDNRELIIIKQENGGAGSARNNALNNVPADCQYAAFLDSDDEWLEDHLATGIKALELGNDAYFSDHFPALHPDKNNFDMIGTLIVDEHLSIDLEDDIHQMSISSLEHIVGDGGGVIGTSNVVYNFRKFPTLRFREEFYNGQDFFFWMDLSELKAQWAFSTKITCRCGRGINIYSGSGWGSEKSLQRLRNELFIWTSVKKFYPLTEKLEQRNKQTINAIQDNIARDILHRIIKRKAISTKILSDIVKMAPSTLISITLIPFKVVLERLK
ncbi:glycosyltransferase family 2 protein [Thalassotalea euphylliae]|uniref:glycosyltransferase family 2 protein n=1 Tax=Thalassotalea euphylliae TaxID=1655234 RepID=UPI0015F284BA|nr:glycosyltransferase family A protein [Thalassotalea euphylliae]